MQIILNHLILAVSVDPGELPRSTPDESAIRAILSIVFVTLGAVALVMIVASGLRYITSAGDPQKASQAKNGIIFSLVGLAIAIAAQGIVMFVGSQL